MKKVRIGNLYDVYIGENLLENTGEILSQLSQKCKVAVFTDENVDELYAQTVVKSLGKHGFSVYKYVYKGGEGSKNLSVYADFLGFLADGGFDRYDLICALGGGVTGDIGGFAAATYMRGIGYVQIPTTLLAAIDSSVGGKTGLDLPQGKNLLGAFYSPKAVVCDTQTLKTLPKEVFLDGMGEGVKYAILEGGELFSLLEQGINEKNIEKFISLCVKVKRRIVLLDEREKGLRKLLNLGHTVAHAIEKLSGYTIPHGRAVMTGLGVIAKASCDNGYLAGSELAKILSLLAEYDVQPLPFPMNQVVREMSFDKKKRSDYLTLIAIKGIGDCELVDVPLVKLEEFFL